MYCVISKYHTPHTIRHNFFPFEMTPVPKLEMCPISGLYTNQSSKIGGVISKVLSCQFTAVVCNCQLKCSRCSRFSLTIKGTCLARGTHNRFSLSSQLLRLLLCLRFIYGFCLKRLVVWEIW